MNLAVIDPHEFSTEERDFLNWFFDSWEQWDGPPCAVFSIDRGNGAYEAFRYTEVMSPYCMSREEAVRQLIAQIHSAAIFATAVGTIFWRKRPEICRNPYGLWRAYARFACVDGTGLKVVVET